MKILRVKVQRESIPGGTHYVYPTEYDPEKVLVVAYETSNPENIEAVRARGNYEYLIGVVEDKDASMFLQSADIVELGLVEAQNAGSTWIKQVAKINDEKRVLEILDKIRVSEPLTIEEQKAIDPADKTEAGVVYGATFSERLSGVVS